jgi:hypothetical protein
MRKRIPAKPSFYPTNAEKSTGNRDRELDLKSLGFL